MVTAGGAACGLLTLAVAEPHVGGAVGEILAALHGTEPTAVEITKRLIAELATMPARDAFVHAAAISVERFVSAEGREGIAAFREKRPPSWAW